MSKHQCDRLVPVETINNIRELLQEAQELHQATFCPDTHDQCD